MQEKDAMLVLKSDGVDSPYSWALPMNHPVLVMMMENIRTLELQNEILCKIVGPKIAKQVKKNIKSQST